LRDEFGVASSFFEGSDPFERICAGLLARNLAPENVTKAIDALRELDLLAPTRLASADTIEVIDTAASRGLALRPSTLAPLIKLARWLVRNHAGRIAVFFDPHHSTGWLRGELTRVPGIGMAGADAILLYALKRPAYPVDRATFRVLVRHGWLEATATYDEARDLLVDRVREETGVLDESEDASSEERARILTDLAHGMDQVGRRYCKMAAPHCECCPLASLLPEGTPRQIDA
jgi:endonuclease-3 related protein